PIGTSDLVDSETSDMLSAGHNLVTSSVGFSGFSASDLTTSDPKLEALGKYGGPTLTIRPSWDSPATAHGDPSKLSATDQRGYSRTVNGSVDIGAVQYQYDLALQANEYWDPPVGDPNFANANIVYSFQITNVGPDPSSGNFTVSDQLPDGVTFVSAPPQFGW